MDDFLPPAEPFRDRTISAFLEELERENPTLPAAGSALALTAASAAALGCFAATLALKKAGPEREEERRELESMARRMRRIQKACLALMDRDVRECRKVLDRMKLPEESREEKREKHMLLQEAYRAALSPALEMTGFCVEMLAMSRSLGEKGYPAAAVDVAVVADMAYGVLRGCRRIVAANLAGIDDGAVCGEVRAVVADREREGERLYGLCVSGMDGAKDQGHG